MNNGIIKWYSPKNGYGFIICESGREVFFHYSEIKFNLHENDKVTFDLYETEKGYNAKNVVKL